MIGFNRRGAIGAFGAAGAALALVAGVGAQAPPPAPTSTPAPQASTPSPPSATAPKRPQFVYVLRPVPRLHDPKAWTDADNAAVSSHFTRLAKATEAGQVILAGRSTEALDKTFGLVVFEAESDAAAREFMRADPAVAGGQMTATLHPYAVALLRKH